MKRISMLLLRCLLVTVLLESRLPVEAAGKVAQLPLPTKTGETFVVDDFDNKVTQTDIGFNYFGGNSGAINNPEPTNGAPPITQLQFSTNSNGSIGGSLRIQFDFTGYPQVGPFAGLFTSLFGLTDTLVSLDGSGREPTNTTQFSGYFLDFDNIYGDFLPMAGRSIETVAFDVRLDTGSEPVTLKVELQDEAGKDVFARLTISSQQWASAHLSRNSFSGSVSCTNHPSCFNWNQVSVLSLIVERRNEGDNVMNPDTGAIFVDNIRLIDDGQTSSTNAYPDLAALANPQDGSLRPEFTDAFLDLVRARSFQYFLDFASRTDATGGIVQDRSPFADLMTVGGVGFQLTAYVIGAERGYIARSNAAERVRNVLRVLHDHPQGSRRVGTIGYQGFFYHFLGPDGLRRQNFNFTATTNVNEALNTVELSTIDTALALMGVVTARQYFNGTNTEETQIRTMANRIYGRVNWPFMLNTNENQFYLGWKPMELRSADPPFEILDAEGAGHYSGTTNDPHTLDFYTDEGLLIALLAMGSPNPTHRVDRSVWDAMLRQGNPFVKTYPGSLFTYQFGSVWLDSQCLGSDNHPQRPLNFFANTRDAVLATRAYAISNVTDRATWRDGGGSNRWGLSAAEGPFDAYFAEAAQPAALSTGGVCPAPANQIPLEEEDGTRVERVMQAEAASERPLELGTVTVYGVGSSIMHAPSDAIEALWESAGLGLLHPRFGFADAFNLDISDAVVAGCVDTNDPGVLRASGRWANFTGFAIDHGPMLAMIDNYLQNRFIPSLFMSHPNVRNALAKVFPPTVDVVASDTSASEPGPDTGRFTVGRTRCTTSALTVYYTLSGTATPGIDFSNLVGRVTIPKGWTSAAITVKPINDSQVECLESVVLTLSNSANYVVGTPSNATVTITDNDLPRVNVVAKDPNASEPGTNRGIFSINRTGCTNNSLSIFYRVSGTASYGPDYTNKPARAASVTIPAGRTNVVITVYPKDDALVEAAETVVMCLSNKPTYIVGSNRCATVTIADKGKAPGHWLGQ